MLSLTQLAHGIQHCHKCRLHQNRLHAVPGEGPANATAVFIGEAPGKFEDRTGKPFQGAAGHFLHGLLAQLQLPHQQFFFTNCVKCRPPANRQPRADELRICKAHWLQPQMALLKPRAVVLLGEVAARLMLDEHQPLKAIHGAVQQHGKVYYLPTYHPAAAMRFPKTAAAMREDLAHLKALL